MARKESTIIYDKHVEICERYLTAEQFGLLMFALRKDEAPDFGDDKLLAMAFEFIALQKNLDDKKYQKICETNRKNARLGGAPKGNQNAKKENNLKTTSKQPQNNPKKQGVKKTTEEIAETLDTKGIEETKQPKQPNAKKNNPKDNEKEKEKEKEKDDDTGLFSDNPDHHDLFSFGQFSNVKLTKDERESLRGQYERSEKLINKVSLWLRSAKNDVPDHFALCVKFANNDNWPRKKTIPPVEPLVIEDPPTEEERTRMVASIKARLNDALSDG